LVVKSQPHLCDWSDTRKIRSDCFGNCWATRPWLNAELNNLEIDESNDELLQHIPRLRPKRYFTRDTRSPSCIRKSSSRSKNLEPRRRSAGTSEIARADRWLPQISFPYGVEPFSANISSYSLKASSRMASNLQFK